MQSRTFEAKRTPEGTIDTLHYARIANAERRVARNKALTALGRSLRRTAAAVVALAAFWNIPALGSGTSKEWPSR